MSDTCKNWTEWLSKTRFASLTEEQRVQTLNWLQLVGDIVINSARIKEGDTVIDVGTGTGLLAFKALEKLNGTGLVIFSDKFQDCLDSCQEFIHKTNVSGNYKMLLSPADKINLADDEFNQISNNMIFNLYENCSNENEELNKIVSHLNCLDTKSKKKQWKN